MDSFSRTVSFVCLVIVLGCNGVSERAARRQHGDWHGRYLKDTKFINRDGNRAPASRTTKTTAESALPACVLNLALPRGGEGCVLCANNRLLRSLRGMLGQSAVILDATKLDLNSPKFTFDDVFAVMAQTRRGRDLVAAFNKYYRSARLYISTEGTARDCEGRMAYFDPNPNPPTVFLCTTGTSDHELGMVISVLAHEMTHAIEFVENPGNMHSIADLKAKGLNREAVIQVIADEIYRSERLAESTQFQFQKELSAAYPCYGEYMRSKMIPGAEFPEYVPDAKLREDADMLARRAVEEVEAEGQLHSTMSARPDGPAI